jgi:hypothetical protein
LSPEKDRAEFRAKAAEIARALENTMNPIAHMQRAFFFQIIGDETNELQAWRKTLRKGAGGMYASFYAASMLNRDRSGEAIDILNRQGLTPDGLEAISRAFLLLDSKHPEEARERFSRAAANMRLKVLAETILLLAGETYRVQSDTAQLLGAIPSQHPDYQALQFYAGRISAEELASETSSSRYQACGNYYLIAMLYLSRGDREAARRYFKRSVETGTHWLVQYQWSRAFLARMERDSLWPGWIPPAGETKRKLSTSKLARIARH